MKLFYQHVLTQGIRHDNHCSDLYVPVNLETTRLVNKYRFKCNVTTFISQIDGKQWYDVPFAYEPYWERRA